MPKSRSLERFRRDAASDAPDIGSPTVRKGGQLKYNGPTLRDHLKSQGLLEQFGLSQI